MPWKDRNLRDTCRVLCLNLFRITQRRSTKPSRQKLHLRRNPYRPRRGAEPSAALSFAIKFMVVAICILLQEQAGQGHTLSGMLELPMYTMNAASIISGRADRRPLSRIRQRTSAQAQNLSSACRHLIPLSDNDKQRFEIRQRGGIDYIRATQGHSLEIDEEQMLTKRSRWNNRSRWRYMVPICVTTTRYTSMGC